MVEHEGLGEQLKYSLNVTHEELRYRVSNCLALLSRGQSDGEHHKAWMIDQVVRCLTEEKYDRWVAEVRSGEDGPETYDWDVGIAP